MRNNNNGGPFGVIRENRIARPNPVAGAGAGAGGFAAGLFGLGAVAEFGGAQAGGAAGDGAGGFGGAQAGGGAGAGGAIFGGGAGAGAGGFGGAQAGGGAGAGAGGFGVAPAGGGAGAGANNDREVTPPTFPFGGGGIIDTPPRHVFIAQPQAPVQPHQVVVQPQQINTAHFANNLIDTPPPSPRGN